jgi:hypothetical protein
MLYPRLFLLGSQGITIPLLFISVPVHPCQQDATPRRRLAGNAFHSFFDVIQFTGWAFISGSNHPYSDLSAQNLTPLATSNARKRTRPPEHTPMLQSTRQVTNPTLYTPASISHRTIHRHPRQPQEAFDHLCRRDMGLTFIELSTVQQFARKPARQQDYPDLTALHYPRSLQR